MKGNSREPLKVLRYLVHLKQVLIVTLSNQTTHQGVNQKPAKRNGVCKDNHDSMSKVEKVHRATY